MSLYHMLNGVNPATFLFLPMLGKHPDEYPRFRDCFVSDEARPEHVGKIIVYTRTGGGNRDAYESENEAMRLTPGFVADYDDPFDCTYACWVFDPPERWKVDYAALTEGRMADVSAAYRAEMERVFPKLAGQLAESFTKADARKADAEEPGGK